MDVVTGAILLAVLAGVLILLFLSAREKSAVKRKRRRRFRPQWKRHSGDTGKRRRP